MNERIIGLGLLFIGFLASMIGMKDNMPKSDFTPLYRKWGARHSVDPELLRAIAIVESGENPNALNPSDPSYGLMQVLCVNDGQNNKCQNLFNILNWDMATPNKLTDPDFNIEMASQIISWNIRTFGILKGIAVYNNFSARFDPDNGPFRNQAYVDKVLAAWNRTNG